jgi:hypothetical protein
VTIRALTRLADIDRLAGIELMATSTVRSLSMEKNRSTHFFRQVCCDHDHDPFGLDADPGGAFPVF